MNESLTPEERLEGINPRARRYDLGQFFTPEAIARYMKARVARARPRTVLDPAVGGGILLRDLEPSSRLFGCDVDPSAVQVATAALQASGATIEHHDFLANGSHPFGDATFDAIICNPPYLRHHLLGDRRNELARRYSAVFGVPISSLSGSYVYFFLEAIRRLREGGVLVFITPVEYLDARYGSPLKSILLDQMLLEEVMVLDTESLAFDGVLTTSAITIATRRTGSEQVTDNQVRLSEAVHRGGELVVLGQSLVQQRELAPGTSWTQKLPSRAARIADLVSERPRRLSEFARIRRGIATADNSFFSLTADDVTKWQIEPRFLVPVVVGSRDLPASGSLTADHWQSRLLQGARNWLFWCHDPEWALAGTHALDYIRHGEERGVDQRFNARSRPLWYSVEQVPAPDYFATYMSRSNARFVRNDIGARCLTSLLNVWVRADIDRDWFHRSITMPSVAELLRQHGRTYGGGLGKIEPGDLRALPMPSPEILVEVA